MSIPNHNSIPQSTEPTDSSSIRPIVRITMVLRLFTGILLELWYLDLLRRVYGPEAIRPRLDSTFHSQAVRFRLTAERMGGLLVKVGQFLSSRVDLLPKPFVQELQALQDRVREAPWDSVKPLIEQELGPVDTVFATFNPRPLASASLGQVYEALTWTGQRLAVKVQRPHIHDIVRADLKAIRIVVALTSRLTRFGRTFDLAAVFAEFRRTVTQELDYRQEAVSAARIAEDCREMPWLKVPKVHENFTTPTVLTMDLEPGIKVSDYDALTAAGIDRRTVAERLIHLYLHMVMDVGFFHADPHPGNILITPDASLVLLDYGMVGHVTVTSRRQMRRLFVGISERRPNVIVDSLYALAIVRPEADRRTLTSRVSYLLERYYAETLQDIRQLDLDHLLRDVESLVREEPVQFPAEFAFLGRAIGMLVGLATGLDPEINLVRLFAPYARRFVTQDSGGPLGFVVRRAQEWVTAAAVLPPVALRVLRQAEDGEMELGVRWSAGADILARLTRSVALLAASFQLVGFVALGVWLTQLGWRLAADAAFAWAGLQFLWYASTRRRQ